MSEDVTATDVASKADLEELEEAAEDDEEEESAESNSVVDKIKKQLPFLSKLIPASKKKAARDEDKTDPGVAIQDDEDEDKPKKAGKKKPNKLILIVVGLGLAMLFAEDFLPKDEPVAEVVPQTPKKKSQRELDKEKAAAAKAAQEGTPAEVPVETPVAEVPAVETPTEEVPPTETPTVSETPAVEPVEPTIEETPSPAIEEPVATIETPTVDEPSVTLDPDTIDPSVMAPNDNASEDQIGVPDDSAVTGGDFTDKILQDLEKQAQDKEKTAPKKRDYVSPPDYEYAGRGLVYNCVGKHWACVDAPSYKTCEQNYDANKALNKKTECYPFNVYEKSKSCQNSQLMMTSSNAKTGFCSE